MFVTSQLFSNAGGRGRFAGSPDNHWCRNGQHNGGDVER
jgi:hypothetical protein